MRRAPRRDAYASEDPEARTVTYFNEGEFRRGRTKMWQSGWVVAYLDTRPGKLPMPGGDSGGIAAIPFLFLTWLVNKTQPEQLLVVTYNRPKRRQ